tara:strand:- start:1392 stop:2342 length:951 start_codon:yes stop_codon:yes gene_type:complete
MEDNYNKQNNKVKLFTLCIFCSFWFAGIIAGGLTYSLYDHSVICNYIDYDCHDEKTIVECVDNCTYSLNNSNITATNNSFINQSMYNQSIYNQSISLVNQTDIVTYNRTLYNRTLFYKYDSAIVPNNNPELREEPRSDVGLALAISVASVFGFIGFCIASVWFIKNKPNPVKRYVTNKTRSNPIKLTNEEKEIIQINPIVKALQNDNKIFSSAIRDITSAIEKDNAHYFKEAVDLYNSGVDKFVVYMKTMTNAQDRFELAKKIDKYLVRANHLKHVINNTALIEDIGNTPSKPVNDEACFCKKYKKIISTGQKISD